MKNIYLRFEDDKLDEIVVKNGFCPTFSTIAAKRFLSTFIPVEDGESEYDVWGVANIQDIDKFYLYRLGDTNVLFISSPLIRLDKIRAFFIDNFNVIQDLSS